MSIIDFRSVACEQSCCMLLHPVSNVKSKVLCCAIIENIIAIAFISQKEKKKKIASVHKKSFSII